MLIFYKYFKRQF